MFFPVFIDLTNRLVLVVGGGLVAERKVEGLIEAGARVKLVSPEATAKLAQSVAEWKQRAFEEADIDGAVLVISATDDPAVQQRVAQAARQRGVLVNTADQPALCDFIVPAVVRQDDVVAAISTSGKSPALAVTLRRKLEAMLSEDVGRAARLLGEIRAEVHSRVADAGERKHVFERILESGLIDWIGECDDATALQRVRELIDRA
jgi:siroheme synthase-like protein